MRSMKIRPAGDADKDRWDEFVFKLSDSPYHLYQWKEILKRVYRYECKYLIAEKKQGISGIFPLALIRSKLFGIRICSLPFSDYGAPLLSSDKKDYSLLNLFLDNISSHIRRADYLEIRSPTQSNVMACLERNLQRGNAKYVTFMINLNKPFEEIWKYDFDKNLRNAIRKAIKNKIKVIENDFEESCHDFYRTYILAMKRLGSPPHRKEFFKACYDLLGDKHVKLFIATMSRKVIGGVFAFLGRYTLYPAYESIVPKYKNLNPASLIFCRMIEWGCENNYRFFDFGRTLHGSGVYHFKKQWGGKEKILPYYYLGKKIPHRDPREQYSHISRLWSKMVPAPLTEKIGPVIKGAIGY